MELPKGGDMQSDNACACFVRVGRCRFGSILGSILESLWEPSSLLYSFLVARVAETGPPKGCTTNNKKHKLNRIHLWGGGCWRPGRPKRSIVANWAPKMTPKWSPKWSQVDNGRPSRNMHRRRQIACPPPLGELHFHSFFRVHKNITKHDFKKVRFKKHAPK